MRKSGFFVFLCFVLFLIGCGGRASVEQSLQGKIGKVDYSKLKAQVEEFNRATINKDFNKVVDWTHPKYVEQFGGQRGFKLHKLICRGVLEAEFLGVQELAFEVADAGA